MRTAAIYCKILLIMACLAGVVINIAANNSLAAFWAFTAFLANISGLSLEMQLKHLNK